MKRYDVTEKNHKNILDFSVNVNLLGMPENVVKACGFGYEQCCFYPDDECTELRKALAQKYGLRIENFLCGNGADDIIFRIPIAFKPKRALIVAPTYEEYQASLELIDCRIDYFILNEKNGFKADERILSAVKPDTDIVYLCNPNNPTGVSADTDLLKRLAEECRRKEILLVIDECFIGFISSENCSMKKFINSYDNLVIIDAFTKLYGMPGFRLGYCISSNKEILKSIKRAGQNFSVSVPAQAAGIAALEDLNYIEDTKKVYAEERAWLMNEMKKMKVTVYNSETNFILAKSPYEGFRNRLLEKGVKVRDCGNFVGLDGEHIRIAVKHHAENQKLVHIIKNLL